MSSKFIERSPESDKTLILVMDEDYNLTGHPKYIDKMLATRQPQELRVVRLRASAADSETDSGDEDGVPKVNLTVEELCPEDAGEEGRTGDSTLPPDIVDPLSQLDNEQMLRLKKALASEQAKQILGENVTAMLDMLSVEENATALLQQSIRFDHCYTNLSPSSDPKGPSFLSSVDSESSTSTPVAAAIPKPRGRPPAGPASSKPGASLLKKSQPTASASSSSQRMGGSDSDDNEILDVDDGDYSESSDETDSDGDRDSDEDYTDRNTPRRRGGTRGGRRGRGGLRMRGGVRRRGRPSKAVESEEEDTQDVSPQDDVPKVPGKRGRPRKVGSEPSPVPPVTLVKPPAVTLVTKPSVISVNKPSTPLKTTGTASTSVLVLDQTQVDTAAAKVISGDAIRLGRPMGKTEEERRRDMARVIQSLEAGGRKVILVQRKSAPKTPEAKTPDVRQQPELVQNNSQDVQVASQVATEDSPSVEDPPTLNKSPTKPKTYERRDSSSMETEPPESSKMMGNKYPRRENRKLPAHLADTALFSAPDVIKRLSAGEEVTVPTRIKTKPTQRSMLAYVRKPNPASTEVTTPAPATKPPVEEPPAPTAEPEPPVTDNASALRAAVDELQTMLEEGLEPKKEVKLLSEPVKPSKEKPEIVKERRSSSGRARRISEKEEKVGRTRRISEKDEKVGRTERRRSSAKQEVEEKVEEKVEPLDALQMDASILQPLPAESMNQLIRSVVEDDKEEPKKEKVKEDTKRDRRASRLSKDSKSGNPGNPSNPATPAPSSSRSKENSVSPTQQSEEKKRNAAKRRRSDEVSDLEEDDLDDDTMSEASWNSEDDPERLWCICRKPHDNRFMICCDLCQDWFHGQCVGISKSLGKQMEADGLEWSCPKCSKKKKEEEKEREANKQASSKTPSSGKGSELKQTKLSNFPIKMPLAEESTPRKCIMCKGPVRENSIYCGDDCIRKHSQRAIAQLSSKAQEPTLVPKVGAPSPVAPVKNEERRIIVMDPTSKKILTGQSAPTAANLSTWLQQNPSYHVLYQRKPTVNPATKIIKLVQGTSVKKVAITPKVTSDTKSSQMKLTVSPNSKQIRIVSDASGNKGIQLIPAAPQKKVIYVGKAGNIVKSQLDSPKVKVEQRQKVHAVEEKKSEGEKKSDGKAATRRRKEKHQVLTEFKQTPPVTPSKSEEKSGASEQTIKDSAKESTKKSKQLQQQQLKPGKTEDKGGGGEQAIRDSVKKTLGEALKARAQECKDLEVADDDIETLVTKIEDRLYRHFDEKVDVKYKSKYRSLVFNIKDQKNETLFRKILEKSISPKDLVKLSADELASQELAQWREKEQQHQLEMIKKTELELMTQGQTFIIKSHKGEDVIAKDHKIAAVAAEIDPNTPAQELVSALNSVSSTTPDNAEDEDKEKHRSGETSLMKMKKREKEKRREKERKRRSKDKDRRRGRSRSRSRDRSSRRSSKSSRKRSRSRSRHRHRDRDRKDKSRDDRKEEKAGGSTPEAAEISTTESLPPAPEIRTPVHVVNDDADYEPTSTVTIKTPETYKEEQEDEFAPLDADGVWAGQIVMAEVAKFNGKALLASGDATKLMADVKVKLSVVGRISYDTVWDYMARMKKMATKDIIVIQILPNSDDEEQRSSFTTLWSYLFKRSRIGVIGKTSDSVKDFYLYPHKASSHLPEVLEPLSIPLIDASEQILLGIIVRSKRAGSSRKSVQPPAVTPTPPPSVPLPVVRHKTAPTLTEPAVPAPAESSSTPPLPPSPEHKKDPRLKRKVRVHVAVEPAATAPVPEDDDSPYSPASSDEDLPPLSKVPRKAAPLPPIPPIDSANNLSDAVQIQKKIEEMNRAIEEQTQQIQSLVSTGPLQDIILPAADAAARSLPAAPPLPLPTLSVPPLEIVAALPGLQALASIVPPAFSATKPQVDLASLKSLVTSTTSVGDRSNTPVPGEEKLELPTPMEVDDASTPMELDIPIPPDPEPKAVQEAVDEPYSPTAPLSPAPPSPPPAAISLPGVSQISLPSNLQEILAAIKQSEPPASPVSPEPLPPGVEDDAPASVPQEVEPEAAVMRTTKLDSVFEKDGVPSFEPGAKGKPAIKFDMKLKRTQDLDTPPPPSLVDVDDRLNLQADRDERVSTSIKDRDERVMPPRGDRDERVTPRDRVSTRDRDDRYSSGSRDKDDRRYRDKDDRYRHKRESKPRDPLEEEWEGSIKQFESEMRKRNRTIREKEIERLRRRSDSE